MSSGIANANPAPAVERIGSDAPGTVDDAESFTRFLENEEAPAKKPKAPRAERNPKPAKAAEDGSDSGDADEGGDRPATERQPRGERNTAPQDDDGPRDPVLDADTPPNDDDDASDDDDEADDSDDEGDDADEGDDEDSDDDDGDDPEYPVTVNGVTQRVKLSDLTAAYSQNLDYTGKTQALANERQEFEAVREETGKQRESYTQGIQVYQDLINAVMPSQAEWDALEKSDPAAFIAAQKQWGGFLEKVEEAKAERDRVQQEADEAAAVRFNEYVKGEDKQLFDKLPQLRNPEVMKKFQASIFGYTRKMGYTDDQVRNGLVNHRDILTAYYASQYMQILESRKANRSKENRGKPKVSEGNSNARPAQTPKGRRAARNSSEQRRADRRLAETGSMDSASQAFAAMFR